MSYKESQFVVVAKDSGYKWVEHVIAEIYKLILRFETKETKEQVKTS